MHLDAHDSAHPCFGPTPREAVLRVHLPVAPRSNLRLRFGSPRPAATAPAILPGEALAWLEDVAACGEPVGMVGITGPGEPLATPETTLETLRLARAKFPGLSLCLTTNGLVGRGPDDKAPNLEALAAELKELRLSHATLLVDAVRPEVAEKLYAWIRPGQRTMPLARAAAALVDAQRQLLLALVRAGITVKINTTVYTGLNAGHVEEIARTTAALGASIMNILPCPAPAETPDESATDAEAPCPPGSELLAMVRDRAARHLPLMTAFEECGDASLEAPNGHSAPASAILPRPSAERPNVAVCSASGMEVDLHLGQAPQFLIYGRREGLPVLLGTRTAPEPGSGSARWEKVAELLPDCFALLAAGAGESPRKSLAAKGLKVLLAEDGAGIDSAVDLLFGGGKKPGCGKKRA
ncbi:NifB/NifX family molybdenum-iron cluster-binding protein [Paucidesulfovibrio longus]|uniref:NifB/NifX family molybdenum-iron cluster-binding protein n=1 Tax=Paucidesulfovibrio longus TaxID=889 RepID=UPI0003B7A9BD|nr:NifB/NifX family molybdenum-iron cluster-binding protein [Paucidesulfovibrio longus]